MAVAFGCRAAPSPLTEAGYVHVLDAIRRELSADTLLLHPFAATVGDCPPVHMCPLREFNPYDTLVVDGVVRARPDAFRRCTLAANGRCLSAAGSFTAVVSEELPVSGADHVVFVLVNDNRRRRATEYAAVVRCHGEKCRMIRLRRQLLQVPAAHR